MMLWNKLAEAIREKAERRGMSLRAAEGEMGISHARAHDLVNAKPVGTEIYLSACHWLNAHPAKFWSGDIRHSRLPD